MPLILISLVLVHVLPLSTLLSDRAEITSFAQNWCLSQIPNSAQSEQLLSAFLCGANIQDHSLRDPFLKTGLIHLLVVSGGHFAVLVMLIDLATSALRGRFKYLTFIKIPILISFSFMTGFQPPVVRALFCQLLDFPNHFFRWHWDQSKLQLTSGVLTLSLFPLWIESLSFYLSWLASLGLCLPPLWNNTLIRKQGTWKSKAWHWLSTCLCIQCLLGLFFWKFSILALIMNLFLAPLLMLGLWPLCLLAVILPFSIPYTDACWKFVLQILDFCSRLSMSPAPSIDPQSLHWVYLWSTIVGIHCALEILTKLRFQKYAA